MKVMDLARQTKIPQTTLQRIVCGGSLNPHFATLKKLAAYFDVTIEQLKGFECIPWLNNTCNQVPLLNWEQAGSWNNDKPPVPEISIFTDLNVNKNIFALKMEDASMEPQFSKNTILIIDGKKEPKDRSFVVVKLLDYPKVIFRQLLIDGQYKYLKPLSPDFEHFKMGLLSEKDAIVGVLIQSRRDYLEA